MPLEGLLQRVALAKQDTRQRDGRKDEHHAFGAWPLFRRVVAGGQRPARRLQSREGTGYRKHDQADEDNVRLSGIAGVVGRLEVGLQLGVDALGVDGIGHEQSHVHEAHGHMYQRETLQKHVEGRLKRSGLCCI